MGLFDSLFGGGGDVGGQEISTLDPNELIQTQARVNRVDQLTPFGSLTFDGPDRNKLNFKLPARMQAMLNSQMEAGNESLSVGRHLLNEVQDPQQIIDAQLARLQPGFDRQDSRLRERLEQSGNPAAFGGRMSEGAFNDLALLGQTQNDARLGAILQGGQVQGQQIGNALAALNGSPIGVPQYNFQGASPIDVTGSFGLSQQGNIFNAEQGNFRAQQNQANRSDMLGGLFDLGVAAIGANFGVPIPPGTI